MNKIVINYVSNNKDRRLVIDKDLPNGQEVLHAILFLHAAGVISLDNVLSIKEEICA